MNFDTAFGKLLGHILRVSLPSIRRGVDGHLVLHLIFVAKNVSDPGISIRERDADAAGGDGKFESHVIPQSLLYR